MIRLLGAITGSALAVGALLLLIGIPQFRAQPAEKIERPVVTLPRATRAVEPAGTSTAAATAAATQVPGEDPEPIAYEFADDFEDKLAVASEDSTAADTSPTPPIAIDAEPDWYAFWSPFRSELAASGFVEQLQRVTGLDYRVVKVKTGVYEVAFAYRDNSDIGTHLSQITAATGLDMAER